MNFFERIPRIWRIAYLYICGWYAINYAISAVIEWQVERPYNYTALVNGFYLLEAVCVSIALIFLYAHFLERYNYTVQIIGHIVGLVVYFLFISYLSYYFNDYLDGRIYLDDWKEYMLNLLSWDAMRYYDQYLITIAVFYMIRYFTSLRAEEQEKSGLELKNKEMQISLLKSQINPHFLFNTLNSISLLVGTDKGKARKVIGELSDVFRYALESHEGEMVTLRDELEFIENYIRIQQVRFGERLTYVQNVSADQKNMQIPPMILQPLVENAVKYGIAPKDEGGTIELTVKQVDQGVLFRVADDGLGINAKKVLDGNSTGVGLQNTDRRLTSIYGKTAGLNVRASVDGYAVSFIIPAKWMKSRNDELVIVESDLT